MALRPYLELIRLPAVFTAPADVLAGAALATWAAGVVMPWAALAGLVAASACVYCAGMAANDIFDVSVDTRERPGRPIPSGRVSKARAWVLVLVLQSAGVGLAAWIGTAALLAVAATIAATYVYNAALKDSLVGPLAMGACRYANACIGLAVVAAPPWPAYVVPAGTALYVAALTAVSRHEVDGATRAQVAPPLYALWLLSAVPAAWALAGVLPNRWAAAAVLLPLAWLAGPVRRALVAPSAGSLRGAVMAGIFGIAMVDAAIAAAAGGFVLAGVTVALLVPGKLVGRWFYAT